MSQYARTTAQLVTWFKKKSLTKPALQKFLIALAEEHGTAIDFADVTLTTAQVLALRATNITLVAAPGASKALVPVAVHMFLDYAGTAYVQAAGTDALGIRYTADTEISELGTEAQMTTFLETTADASLYINIQADFVPVANKALVLDNKGAAEYATGTSPISVRVFFRIVPIIAFT